MNFEKLLAQKIRKGPSAPIQKVTLTTDSMLNKEEKKILKDKQRKHEKKQTKDWKKKEKSGVTFQIGGLIDVTDVKKTAQPA